MTSGEAAGGDASRDQSLARQFVGGTVGGQYIRVDAAEVQNLITAVEHAADETADIRAYAQELRRFGGPGGDPYSEHAGQQFGTLAAQNHRAANEAYERVLREFADSLRMSVRDVRNTDRRGHDAFDKKG